MTPERRADVKAAITRALPALLRLVEQREAERLGAERDGRDVETVTA